MKNQICHPFRRKVPDEKENGVRQVKGDRGSGRGVEVDGDGVGSEEGGAIRPCLPSLAIASLAQPGSLGLLDCLFA